MTQQQTSEQPVLLTILDGFGYSKDNDHNAISQARTPHYDKLLASCPQTRLDASGEVVGLPESQMGNSEVGHINIGAGRTVLLGLSRINQAIKDGSFFKNPTLLTMTEDTPLIRAIHLIGLVSSGGVHSHIDHFKAVLRLCKQRNVKKVFIHAFLDGRDTPPQSAQAEIDDLEQYCQELGIGEIISISGRYYAMDRDKNWERTAAVYNTIVKQHPQHHASSAQQAITQAYERGETDEFVQPTLINSSTIDLEDAEFDTDTKVISLNFRADRIRQLIETLVQPSIIAPLLADDDDDFMDPIPHIAMMTQYSADLTEEPSVETIFPPEPIKNTLGEVLASHNKKQLRIAETEKYAHVTYFLSGGRERPFKGEKRRLIQSPKVATYDQQPQMSAETVTQNLIEALDSAQYDCIIANFANADMVGHTGDFQATIQAVEWLDSCLGELISACERNGYALIVTADHGNAEQMYDLQTQQPHTAHTNNWVPFIYKGQKGQLTNQTGSIIDIAPTLLKILGLDIPDEMKGQSLLQKDHV